MVHLRRISSQQFRQAKDQLGAVAEQGIPFSRRRNAAEPGCADEVLRSTTTVLKHAAAALRSGPVMEGAGRVAFPRLRWRCSSGRQVSD